MKTKFLIAVLAIGLFTVSTMKAQDNKSSNKKHDQVDKTIYACPMHPEITSESTGECTKCSMVLEKKKMPPNINPAKVRGIKTVKTYVCSMHSDEVSGKTGKCPVCGMKLKKVKPKKSRKVKQEQI